MVGDKITNKLLILNEKRKKIQNNTINLLNSKRDENKSKVIFKYKEK